MAHDWVFDVLEDLKAYALANGLKQLAQKAEEALHVASDEVAAQNGPSSMAVTKAVSTH